jgi:hypothetical protein
MSQPRNQLVQKISDTCVELTHLAANQRILGYVSTYYKGDILIPTTGIQYELFQEESHL